MASGRSSDDRQRRRRRGESPAGRRSGRARPREAAASASASGRRPGGQSSARSPRNSGAAGAFKLSSTRRAAVLAMLVCAMALSVAVPLRTYWGQRQELADQQRQQTELSQQVTELEQRRSELSDPSHVEAEARQRLGYVRPGETPYIVESPPAPSSAAAPPGVLNTGVPQSAQAPWYERLWDSLTGEGS